MAGIGALWRSALIGLALSCGMLLHGAAVCCAESDAVDVTLNLLGSAGRSSLADEAYSELAGGEHDPRRSGFSFQQAELILGAQLDGWLRADAHLVRGEEHFEVEEAYLSGAPHPDLLLRAGLFYSPFGLSNPRHPHAWHWIDQNIAVTRMFGGENSRGLGLQGSWELNGHARRAGRSQWRSSLGISLQRADDPSLLSFRGKGHAHGHGDDDHRQGHGQQQHDGNGQGHADEVEELEEHFGRLGIGNRPYFSQPGSGNSLLTARWENAWQAGNGTRLQLGLSAMHGPNASGASGRTTLTGADFSLLWQPGTAREDERWPFLLWENEYIQRRYKASAVFDNSEPGEVIDISGVTLRDWAGCSQLLYGFAPGWAAGLRYECAGGEGESIGGRSSDPLRDKRTRLSPLLGYWPDDSLRLRLQYNHDKAQHLGHGNGYGSARSVWLGVDWTVGRGHRHSAAAQEFLVPGHSHADHDHGHSHAGHDGHSHAEHDEPAHRPAAGTDSHAEHDHHGHSHAH